MKRRTFLSAAAAAMPTALLANFASASASASAQQAAATCPVGDHVMKNGEDRNGSPHSLGFSSIAFKVTPCETGGGLLLIEHMHLSPGGPPLHMHLNQEEYFYVVEGAVVFQVGEKRFELNQGESVLAPRLVAHAFSSLRPSSRMLIAFTPAGRMEDYFRDGERNRGAAFTPDFMNRYEMKYVGPSPFAKTL